MKDNLRYLPLKQIRPNKVALREVDHASDDFTHLVDSIRDKGIINPVSVREGKDSDTGETFFWLIDGLHRYTAAQEAGLEAIPVHIIEASEAESLYLQIIANIARVETKPVEYSKQLMRILTINPTMTVTELANELKRSVSWVSERMGLLKLAEPVAKLVNEGNINITNAYALAKLPKEEQANFVDRALTMTPAQFVPTVNARAKELRDAKREGRKASESGFVPVSFFRKKSEVENEVTTHAVGEAMLADQSIDDPLDAWILAIKWVLNLDPVSVELGRQKAEQLARDKEEAKERRKREAQEKREREAVETAASVA